MKKSPLQFAITREDPSIESRLIQKLDIKNILLICSAGDTALALLYQYPNIKMSVLDFNSAQLEHFKLKAKALLTDLNRENKPLGLCQNGNFESLFRMWRNFFNEFILNTDETKLIFANKKTEQIKNEILTSPYWPVSFDLYFHDSLLREMFGESAIQHAPKGSYPRYFQKAFEKGLSQSNFYLNPFLQHLFLGEYLELPNYFKNRPSIESVAILNGILLDVTSIKEFDLIQLSNIFDWMNLEDIKKSIQYLNKEMKKGASVLIRQINNDFPLDKMFGENFSFDYKLGEELLTSDLSLFYSRILIGTKIG